MSQVNIKRNKLKMTPLVIKRNIETSRSLKHNVTLKISILMPVFYS